MKNKFVHKFLFAGLFSIVIFTSFAFKATGDKIIVSGNTAEVIG